MDRLISEQDVIDAMAEALKHGEGVHNLLGRILAIPSAEPCEDAISRDAVLKKAGYTETEEGWCGYTVDVDYIKSLPSVNPQSICEEREKGECPYYAG